MSVKTETKPLLKIPPKSHFYDYRHEMAKYVYIDRARGVVVPENMLTKLDKNLLSLTKHKAIEDIAKNIYIAVFRRGESGWYLDKLIDRHGEPVEDRELKEMVEEKLRLWRIAGKKYEFKNEDTIHHALASMNLWLSKAGLVKEHLEKTLLSIEKAKGEEREKLERQVANLLNEMEKLVQNAYRISQGYIGFRHTPRYQGEIGEIELPKGILRILIKNTYNYTVLNIYSPYDYLAQEIQERLLKSLTNAKPGKYGYSILLPRIKNYVELYDLVKTIYDDAIQPLSQEIREIIIKKKVKEAEEIEKARKELGINIPPEKEITGEDIARLILETETPTAGEEQHLGEEEIPEIEEILEEVEGVVPVSTAVGQEKAKREKQEEAEEEKEIEEKIKKIREIMPEDIARMMAKHGFMRVKMFVFDLPTEYLGARTKYEKVGKKYIESKIFGVNPAKYRTLRKKFYTLLHKVAFRTPSGWIMYNEPSRNVLGEIDKVINELNKLSGKRRAVYLMELYLPKDYVEEWITNNIHEIKANIEEIKNRLVNEELKKREVKRLEKRLNELLEELKSLEKQLKYIQA